MSEEEKPKKLLEWRWPGKRPLGRPRKRWIEGADKAVEKREASIGEIEEIRKHERRGKWRSLIKDAPANR